MWMDNPRNNPTVRVCQHLEDKLTKAGADTDDILALTTTRGSVWDHRAEAERRVVGEPPARRQI